MLTLPPADGPLCFANRSDVTLEQPLQSYHVRERCNAMSIYARDSMSPDSAEVLCCTMSSWPRAYECKMIRDSDFKPCIKTVRCTLALCFTFTSQSLSCYFGTLPLRNSPPFADYFDQPAQFSYSHTGIIFLFRRNNVNSKRCFVIQKDIRRCGKATESCP
jgi:hypothetical protein